MSDDNKNFLQSSGGIIVAIILVVVSFSAGAMYMKLQNEKETDGKVQGEQTTNNDNSNVSSDFTSFETYAEELGLEMGEFKKCLNEHKYLQKIKDDVAVGEVVQGTPTFFVNGKKVEIDQTADKSRFDALKRYIDAELAGSPLSGETNDLNISDADPQKGKSDAKVTLVEFSDFQCPYCATGGKPALEQVLAAYPDDVKGVWKNYPLDQACNENITSAFHANACAAAEVVMCANEQGKFWEMHDNLFDNQSEWSK